MPIIYSYPSKISPSSGDLLIISDVAASNQTKKITIGDLKDPLDVVDTIIAGDGISVSSPTGDVTIGNTGVLTVEVGSFISSFGTPLAAVDAGGGTTRLFLYEYNGGSNVGFVPSGGTGSTFLRGDGTWQVPSGGGGGGSLTVKNEGVDLTTSASSINFTGVGVTATTVGDDVTINIPDKFVIEDVQLASAVSKGTALYISGPAHGSGRVAVDIADATDNTKMPVVGLALANYSAGEGKMIVTGILDDIDTSNTNIPGGTLGNVVYVDNSGVDNNLTGTKPTGTDLIQNVGIITKSGANGSMQVTCTGRTNDLPNLPENNIWLGNSIGVPSRVSNSLDNLVDVFYDATNDASMYIGNGAPSGLSGTPTKTTAVGEGAGQSTTTGSSNTLIGTNSGSSIAAGSTNTLIGSDSGDTIVTGTGNVVIGSDADTTTDAINASVVVGSSSSSASRGTAIGSSASANSEGIAIGFNATAGQNELAIGNITTATLNAGGETPSLTNKFLPIKIWDGATHVQYYLALYQ